MFLPVRTESFASEAQRKLAVLTTNADVLAGRCLAAYCYVFGDMRSIAPFSGSVRVALLGSYEAGVEPAQRSENNFTSERRWASRILPVSRRSSARGN